MRSCPDTDIDPSLKGKTLVFLALCCAFPALNPMVALSKIGFEEGIDIILLRSLKEWNQDSR